MKELSMYIHIPFCKSKCSYCDFLSFAERDDFFAPYCDALIKEIKISAEKYKDYSVKTIFFGGGTPSLVPSKNIVEIMQTVFKEYCVDNNAEITIECNPESAEMEKLLDYKECGINRISFGVQSFDNRILKRIGRIHSIEKFIENFNIARSIGFENISLDLMYGLPEQSFEDFMATIKSAVALKPNHISCYGLILEEGTALYNEKDLVLMSEDEEYSMYSFAKEYLQENGYMQYEISNYARDDYQSKHNLAYWTDKEYVGFGLGASSYIGGKRFHITEEMLDYIYGDYDYKDIEELTLEEQYSEFMFLGMRKIAGIKEKDFFDKFNISVYETFGDKIQKHIGDGLLEVIDRAIRLTEKGVYLSNIVFADLLL